MPRPLKRRLRDQLVDAIGVDIVGGRVPEGANLPPEEEILATYDVSRTVLREALNVLSGKGLVDARPRRGTTVRPATEWNHLDPDVLAWRRGDEDGETADEVETRLDQLMEIRRIIEPAAAALAARRATPSDRARMIEAYQSMEQDGIDAERFMEADLAFHTACLFASHNNFLLPVVHAIRSEMMTSLRITNRDAQENRTVSLPLHKAILDAVLGRDAAAAEAAMQVHLDDTEKRRARARRLGLRRES